MFGEKKENVEYFRIEKGGIVRLVNGVGVYSLDINGQWVPNQYLFSLFVDSMEDYWPISEDEVNEIIKERKRTGNRKREGGAEGISKVRADWKVVRMLGRGSYGCVYEMEREQFGKKEKAAVRALTIPQDRSVIDEMHSNGWDDESISRRMDDDLRKMKDYLMAVEGHPNIVNCDDLQYRKHPDGFGYDVFIRMELLTPLNEAARKERNAEELEEMALKLGKDICRALEACKKKEIVYRDIKPNNIFLSESGSYKLGDFGIDGVMEHTSMRMGANRYMAPEVYNHCPYGHTADIYSLGLVMYWLLNENRMPFLPLPPAVPTAAMENQANAKRYGGAVVPAPKNGSASLKSVVLKACAYDRKERFASAEEMLHALEEIQPGVRRYPNLPNETDKTEFLMEAVYAAPNPKLDMTPGFLKRIF